MVLAFNARNGSKGALNAQNGHQPGAERPELCARAFFMPNWVQGCKSLNTSGSVDPTGSPQDLWTPQDPHLPSLTLFSLLNHPLFPINTHPFYLPFTTHIHTPTYLQNSTFLSHPIPPIWPNIHIPPSPPYPLLLLLFFLLLLEGEQHSKFGVVKSIAFLFFP